MTTLLTQSVNDVKLNFVLNVRCVEFFCTQDDLLIYLIQLRGEISGSYLAWFIWSVNNKIY